MTKTNHSRRALLTASVASVALMATGSIATANADDPIYQAINAHRTAWQSLCDFCAVADEGDVEADAEHVRLLAHANTAAVTILSAEIATSAGILALVRYAVDRQREGDVFPDDWELPELASPHFLETGVYHTHFSGHLLEKIAATLPKLLLRS